MISGISNGNTAVMAFFDLNYKHVPLVRFLAERIDLKRWDPRNIDLLSLTSIDSEDAWSKAEKKTECFLVLKDMTTIGFDIIHHAGGKFHVDTTTQLIANQWTGNVKAGKKRGGQG